MAGRLLSGQADLVFNQVFYNRQQLIVVQQIKHRPLKGIKVEEKWFLGLGRIVVVHIPAHHEHPFRTNVNTSSGLT